MLRGSLEKMLKVNGQPNLVVKHFILLLHTRHERILRQRIFPRAILLVRTPDLLFERLHVGRQQSMEAKGAPLFSGKRRPFVIIRRG